MSVNQSRTYCTPSRSIRASTSLRTSGSDVARSLLSIIAIERSSSGWTEATLYRQRALHRQLLRAVDVAEAAIQRLHRLVAALRPRDELADARPRGPVELCELQRAAEPTSAPVAPHRRQPVLGRPRLGSLQQPRIADGLVLHQRDERALRTGRLFAQPRLEPVRHLAGDRQVL